MRCEKHMQDFIEGRCYKCDEETTTRTPSYGPVKISIEESRLIDIYIALRDASDRLGTGTLMIDACVSMLEGSGYMAIDKAKELAILIRQSKEIKRDE